MITRSDFDWEHRSSALKNRSPRAFEKKQVCSLTRVSVFLGEDHTLSIVPRE